MPGNYRKEDLRITKTYKALFNAMRTLLSRRNFEKITVNDLCVEALISRVTFYSHFNDKYDFLKYCLAFLKDDMLKSIKDSGESKPAIYLYAQRNAAIINNLLENANGEVLTLLHDFVYSIFYSAIDQKADGHVNCNQMLLSNFCAGGTISIIRLYAKNKFEPQSHISPNYFLEMIRAMLEWDANYTEDSSAEVRLHEQKEK